jgi:hypothetical protein
MRTTQHRTKKLNVSHKFRLTTQLWLKPKKSGWQKERQSEKKKDTFQPNHGTRQQDCFLEGFQKCGSEFKKLIN